jgi:protein O-GlcNAc transferase
MGVALTEQGKRQEAIDYFQKAIEINPEYSEAYSYLIHQLQHTCNWRSLKIYSEMLDKLNRQTCEGKPFFVEPPFISMTRHSDLCQHLTISKAWSRKITQPLQNVKLPFSFETRRQKKRKLTIGYLSSDFHDHATAHLMLSVFGLHNRENFKINCYSYGPDDQSNYRQQILNQSDRFINIRDCFHIDAAKQIYADGVDILVDLKGHTRGARLAILACRPAPVQVHYLGYPGTTGAEFIDYLVTDRIVTPEEHAPYYSEKLVFLPHCYQVNDHHRKLHLGIGIGKPWDCRTMALCSAHSISSTRLIPLCLIAGCGYCSRYPTACFGFLVTMRMPGAICAGRPQTEGSSLIGWCLHAR